MKFAFIPGDGVGIELGEELHKICGALANYTNIKFDISEVDLSLTRFRETGVLLPETVKDMLTGASAIWAGPFSEAQEGGRSYNGRLMKSLLTALDCTIHCRHLTDFNPNIDTVKYKPFDVFIIQNSPNLAGETHHFVSRLNHAERVEHQINIWSESALKPLLEYAQNIIEQQKRKKIVIVNPSMEPEGNQLVSDLARQLAENDELTVKMFTAERVVYTLLQRPHELDMIISVAPFGSILSRVGSFLEGGLGLGFVTYGDQDGDKIYQVLHPASTGYVGKDAANPLGAVRALAAILKQIKRPGLAKILADAVFQALDAGWSTRDMGGSMGTTEIGDFICAKLAESAQ